MQENGQECKIVEELGVVDAFHTEGMVIHKLSVSSPLQPPPRGGLTAPRNAHCATLRQRLRSVRSPQESGGYRGTGSTKYKPIFCLDNPDHYNLHLLRPAASRASNR